MSGSSSSSLKNIAARPPPTSVAATDANQPGPSGVGNGTSSLVEALSAQGLKVSAAVQNASSSGIRRNGVVGVPANVNYFLHPVQSPASLQPNGINMFPMQFAPFMRTGVNLVGPPSGLPSNGIMPVSLPSTIRPMPTSSTNITIAPKPSGSAAAATSAKPSKPPTIAPAPTITSQHLARAPAPILPRPAEQVRPASATSGMGMPAFRPEGIYQNMYLIPPRTSFALPQGTGQIPYSIMNQVQGNATVSNVNQVKHYQRLGIFPSSSIFPAPPVYMMNGNGLSPQLVAQINQPPQSQADAIMTSLSAVGPSTSTALVAAGSSLSADSIDAPPLLGAAQEAPILKETSDDDENEPPPLLIRDEVATTDVNEMFMQEAAGMRQQWAPPTLPGVTSSVASKKSVSGNGKPVIKHEIEGFVIEESHKPFKLNKQCKLVAKNKALAEAAKSAIKSEFDEVCGGREREEEVSGGEEGRDSSPALSPSVKKRKVTAAAAASKSNARSPSKKQKETRSKQQNRRRSDSPPVSVKRKSASTTPASRSSRRSSGASSKVKSPPSANSRANRELLSLLGMDFGPGKTPFKTTSVDEYKKEIAREQTYLRPGYGTISYEDKDGSDDDGTTAKSNDEAHSDASEQYCLGCHRSFDEIGRRSDRHPQYCSRECRATLKATRRKSGKVRRSDTLNSTMDDSDQSSVKSSSRKRSFEPSTSESTSQVVSPAPAKIQLKLKSPSDVAIPASSTDVSLPVLLTPVVMSPPILSTPSAQLSCATPTATATTSGSGGLPDHLRAVQMAGLSGKPLNDWDAEDVEQWVNHVTVPNVYGALFREQEIDGYSLALLNTETIQTCLKIKLGPALKISKAIEGLKAISAAPE